MRERGRLGGCGRLRFLVRPDGFGPALQKVEPLFAASVARERPFDVLRRTIVRLDELADPRQLR
jgi:hypothetical protein